MVVARKPKLVNNDGALIGVTSDGGAYPREVGTVFTISTSGDLQTLHSFGHGRDGWSPKSAVLNVNGVLYGTTIYGGRIPDQDGVIYALTP